MKYLIDIILKHPRLVSGVFLVCVGILGWQARHFQIDASAETLLTKNNKLYMQSQVMGRRFPSQEFLLIAYEPKNHPVFSRQTFADLESISAELRKIDRVESVRSIVNVPLVTLMEGDLAESDPSEWTIEKKDFGIAELKKTFKGHPIYEGLLINKQQTATTIQVLFRENKQIVEIRDRIIDLQEKALQDRLSDGDREKLERFQERLDPLERELNQTRSREIREIRRILVKYEDSANIYLGGAHVLGYQLIQIIKNDLIVFGGIIAIVICMMLFVLFRKPRWIIITAACCVCSVLPTMGLFGILGLKTTVISSSFVALQLILTLALVVHLIVQYREYCNAHADWSQSELIRQTFLRKVKPTFYAGLTTSVGFSSLLFTSLQPVISFGWMMVIAMAFSIVVSLILFPALLALLPRERAVAPPRLFHAILSWVTHVVQKRKGLVLLTGGMILASGAVGLLRLDVENSFINYFRKSTDVYRELSFIDREMGGTTPLDIIYTIPASEKEQDLVLTADTVQQLQRIQAKLKQYEAVGKVVSIVSATELAKRVNDDKPLTEYELTALYWILEDSLRTDLLGSFISPEHSQVRFSIRIQDTTKGLDRAELLADVKNDMRELGIPPDRYVLTGLFVLYQDILQRLFRSQILAMGIVFIALMATFYLLFRSVPAALAGITPNIFAIVLVLGVMGWLKIPLDIMTITIASIAMGIAVDDSIHYIHRYLEERRSAPGDQAVEQTNFSVGYAVIYTSLIVILGFSLLAFSDFMPSVLFGLLTSLAMVLALLGNLYLLPVLLIKFVKKQ